jgi:protein ImuB
MFACIYVRDLPAGLSLTDFAYNFSPFIEEIKPNLVVLDVEGCELLFGSAYQLAREASDQAKKLLKTTINVALAANPDAAIHAASVLAGVTFVAPGEELTCLGDFPLTLLDYSLVNIEEKRAAEILETLNLWGVKTFHDFATLPVAGVSERLGVDGLKLQKLAGGKTERHLIYKQSPPVFAGSIELEHPITELEPLSFIFARLLNQICASLNSHALATNELLVRMQLDQQTTTHERTLTLPSPMRDHKVFLKLLLLDMEMHPPQSPVKSVSINCEPVKPRVLQNGLFVPLAPAPDKLELTLARLSKLIGEENIGSPQLIDTHRPDAFSMKRFALQTKEAGQRRKRSQPQPEIRKQQCFGFRMFRPPLRAVVEIASGWPVQISAWGKQRSVYGKVVSLAGPWRSSGDWWRKDKWARDEWDVAIETGKDRHALYRIYRELQSGHWFVEGNYD